MESTPQTIDANKIRIPLENLTADVYQTIAEIRKNPAFQYTGLENRLVAALTKINSIMNVQYDSKEHRITSRANESDLHLTNKQCLKLVSALEILSKALQSKHRTWEKQMGGLLDQTFGNISEITNFLREKSFNTMHIQCNRGNISLAG
jgi:hypothetical protein